MHVSRLGKELEVPPLQIACHVQLRGIVGGGVPVDGRRAQVDQATPVAAWASTKSIYRWVASPRLSVKSQTMGANSILFFSVTPPTRSGVKTCLYLLKDGILFASAAQDEAAVVDVDGAGDLVGGVSGQKDAEGADLNGLGEAGHGHVVLNLGESLGREVLVQGPNWWDPAR